MFWNSKKKINKNLIYLFSFIFISLISLVYKLFLSGSYDGVFGSDTKTEPISVVSGSVSSESQSPEASETTETSGSDVDVISVYICGQIEDPGVYEVPSGSIVNDVIELAGGLTSQAASDRINLVYIIDSNISIYIPKEDESYEGDGIIRSEGQSVWGNTGYSQSGSSESGIININTATEDELMTLPGIGQTTACAIVEYREQTPFTRPEDIMNVSGIGEAKYNNIRDLICV